MARALESMNEACFPPIPIKAIWFMPVIFLINLLFAGGADVSHIGHLGGALVAAWIMRENLSRYVGLGSLRHRWRRWRMRNRLRSVQRDEWERRRADGEKRGDQDR